MFVGSHSVPLLLLSAGWETAAQAKPEGCGVRMFPAMVRTWLGRVLGVWSFLGLGAVQPMAVVDDEKILVPQVDFA